MEAQSPPISNPPPVTGFLPAASWAPVLASHPDQRFAAFLRRGIEHGFRIGANPSLKLRSSPAHLPSAASHPAVISHRIAEEVAAGTLVPVTPLIHGQPAVHCSPIGIIPKPHQPGKFRLIVDLSSPHGASVNDAISPDLSSLTYPRVDQAAALISMYGQGALIAKLDLHSAYRKVPVHPDDTHLLGIEWEGTTYLDRALPFGLRSAPKLFTAVADGYSWALVVHGYTDFTHYLDDFLFWSTPDSPRCGEALQTALRLGTALGLPAAPAKVVGPTTTLTFLGIEIDTVAQQLRLPADKLGRLKRTLLYWSESKNPTKRQLQSLIGLLNHAASVVPPGRTFTRELIANMKRPSRPEQRTRLTALAKADIAWWRLFVDDWNGVGILPRPHSSLPSQTVVSDASGSWGCGAFTCTDTQFFQLQWPQEWSTTCIAAKELLPIVASAAMWGASWRGKRVWFRCDNMAAVDALSSRTARDPVMAHLLRCLFFIQAHFEFELSASHIPGRDNRAADALSRNRLHVFLSLHPQASPSPAVLPSSLKDLLLLPPPPWTSNHWADLFKNILREASLRTQ